jgi:hypothetical protein
MIVGENPFFIDDDQTIDIGRDPYTSQARGATKSVVATRY